MRVYHFVKAKYGLLNLEKRRLKISIIMELNDPFEFLGADLSDRNFRKAIKKTKKDDSGSTTPVAKIKKPSNKKIWHPKTNDDRPRNTIHITT